MKLKISDYVHKIIESISRNSLVDDLETQVKLVRSTVVPSLELAARDYRGQDLHSGYALSISTRLNKVFKKDGCMFQLLAGIMENGHQQLDAVIGYVEKNFTNVTPKEAVTYRRAAVLQYIEVTALTIEYTQRVLMRLLAHESAVLAGGADEASLDAGVTKDRLKFFDDNYAAWIDGLRLLNKAPAEVTKMFDDAPDVAVDAGAEEAMLGMGVSIDPVKSNFISVQSNPIYHLRAYLAERQVKNIKAMQEERRIVELRLHEIQQLRNGGTPDAVVQHQIEVVQSRLNKLDGSLAAFFKDLQD